jgi:hypothetical protein
MVGVGLENRVYPNTVYGEHVATRGRLAVARAFSNRLWGTYGMRNAALCISQGVIVSFVKVQLIQSLWNPKETILLERTSLKCGDYRIGYRCHCVRQHGHSNLGNLAHPAPPG